MAGDGMDYDAWKLFIDASELGSLSKVAFAYGTSQPLISRRIRELERQCGGRLFERTGRGVVLTELGQRVAPRVRAWMASTDQLVNDVRSSTGTPIGKVRIGSLPSTAHPLMSTLVRQIAQRYPLIQLAVREGLNAQIEAWLNDGSVDFATLYRNSPKPLNGEIYLAETSVHLVGAKGDRLTARPTIPFSALDKLPLVLLCRPNSWRSHLEQLAAERGVTLNVVLEADSPGIQSQIASEGGIHALLGSWAIAAAANRCRLQASRLVSPAVNRYVALAVSRHAQMTLACRTVMQVAQEVGGSGAARLRPVASR
jgi:DNA-binding transcriptional LysR family regulator